MLSNNIEHTHTQEQRQRRSKSTQSQKTPEQRRRNSRISRSTIRLSNSTTPHKTRVRSQNSLKSIDDLSPYSFFHNKNSSQPISNIQILHQQPDLNCLSSSTTPTFQSQNTTSSLSIQENFITDTQRNGYKNISPLLQIHDDLIIKEYLDTCSPNSKSSLEIIQCLKEAREMSKKVVENLGPHQYGVDLFEGFKMLCLKKQKLSKSDFKKLFTSGRSGFYDYCYLRELEAMLVGDFSDYRC